MAQNKVWEIVQEALPFLGKRRPGMPRERLLALRPARAGEVTWEHKPDDAPAPGAALTVPRREEGLRRVLARVLQVPGTRTIELDEFGTKIWEQCDGTRTVEQLVQFTCREYTLNRRQGEVSVVAFMRMLAQRGLIGFPGGGSILGGSERAKETTDGSSRDDKQYGRNGRTAPKRRRRF